ncbi:MAG TPA: DUF4129 domain-containing protein [Bryobacteraceae bacterium]|nr:DUF4129 domain-containing protein [Bryobacteraceae bacterium]
MAQPLGRDGAIPLLEAAAHLLRRTPPATLLCSLMGTAPLALGLLLFWNDVTSPHTTNATCAIESAVLALLLAWMNCWRAVFAGRLRRQLTGAPDSPWNWRRTWRLFGGQAFLGSSKLVVLPLSALIIFPFAWMVAFYRSAAVLADRDDLDPLQVISRARQLAGLQRLQSWAVLPIFAFAYLVLAVNLALTLAALPQLVRVLTGYESEFSRSGVFFVFTPLFLLSVIFISWMAFDPFIQAVYCVRCFRGESVRTGEDLRAGLRALRIAGAVLLLLILPIRSFSAVSTAELEKSVRQAMQSHEYDWRLPAPPAPAQHVPWLIKVTDRLVDGVKSVLGAIRDAIHRLLDWLRNRLNLPMPQGGKAPARGLHWGLYILIGVVVVVAIWIAWQRRWLRGQRPRAAAHALPAVRLDAEDLSPDRLPEESWLSLAARSLEEQNFRFALRAFYLANLAWLGRREFLTIHPGKTNREYELELRRKARTYAEARQLFSANVADFERAWYGLHEVTASDANEFSVRVDQMKSILIPPQGAAA